MNNEDFFQQFRQMFNDPEQRPVLVEYFNKCVEQAKEEPKPMRVAVVTLLGDFDSLVKTSIFQVDEISPSAIDRRMIGSFLNNLPRLTLGNLELIRCNGDMDIYGVKFDAFFLNNQSDPVPQFLYDICFYFSACNVPKLTTDQFFDLINLHAPNPNPCSSESQ